MRYRLKAVGPAGQVEALDVEGFDEASVVRQAKERGYTVLALRPRASLALAWPGARARFPLAAFTHDLLVLLDAGLPLVEAIQALAERASACERAHGARAAGLLAAAAAAAFYALSRPAVRAAIEEALWRLPALGERLAAYQLARFYRTVGMLVRSGVPLVSALQMGGELLRPAMRERLAGAVRAIREGRPVAASLAAGALTTPVALRMLSVGEQAGRMGEMMERVAALHDEGIPRLLDWTMRLVEPLLMAAIGLAVGAIVILMYMPIFELAGSLQ